jgi:hypothetical protein
MWVRVSVRVRRRLKSSTRTRKDEIYGAAFQIHRGEGYGHTGGGAAQGAGGSLQREGVGCCWNRWILDVHHLALGGA